MNRKTSATTVSNAAAKLVKNNRDRPQRRRSTQGSSRAPQVRPEASRAKERRSLGALVAYCRALAILAALPLTAHLLGTALLSMKHGERAQGRVLIRP